MLSNLGHLIKFFIDHKENIDNQALALTLPQISRFDSCHWDIGVRRDKVMFIMSAGVHVIIFELIECVKEDGVLSFKWYQIRSIVDEALWDLNSYGGLLSFHPYQRGSLLFYYHFGNNNTGSCQIEYEENLYSYVRYCGLPLLEC